MARTRGIQLDQPDIELQNTDDDAVRTDDETTEQEILAELHKSEDDNSYVVFVSRVLGPSRQGFSEPQLFKGDAKTLLPSLYEDLRRVTKPGEVGTYRIRILKNGKFWRKFDVAVERPSEEAKPVVVEKPASELAAVLAAFQASQDRMLALIETRLGNAPAFAQQQTDPFQSIERITAIIKNLQPATPPAAPEGAGAALFAAFKSGIEVMKDAGGGGEAKGIYDIIDSMLNSPVMGAVANALANSAAATAPAPQPARLPQPVAAAPQVPQQQPPAPPKDKPPQMSNAEVFALLAKNPALQSQAKQSCDYLTSLAARNGDIETYAFWVCDNWDRRFIELLLNRPDWFALICAVTPEAQAHHNWFTRLVAEILNIVNDADNAAQSTNGDARRTSLGDTNGNPRRTSGDAGDVEANGDFDEAGED